MSEIVLQQQLKGIPPRITRNKSALEKYLSDNNIESQFPSIENQLFTIPIKNLPLGAFNPSVIRFRDRLVMSYRYHPDEGYKTKLAIAELDENFNVVGNFQLDMGEDDSQEDSRLFVWKGELWCSFVVSQFPHFPASQVKIAKLSKPDKWRVSDKELYYLPDRQTTEKNHLPLVHDDVLNIIYKHNQPQEGNWADLSQIIYSPFEKREMKTPALRWPYGEVRGGTVPLPYEGRMISFFHSSLDNFPPQNPRCYFVGAVLRKSEPPFQMLAISKRPILRGSEVGGDKSRFHWKSQVIFPLGAIEHEGGWLLSCGQNDSASILVKVKPDNLNL